MSPEDTSVSRQQVAELVSTALQKVQEDLGREACDGVVAQILGPVVDVRFKGALPKIGSLLRAGDSRKGLPLEAVELLGDGVIRSLALGRPTACAEEPRCTTRRIRSASRWVRTFGDASSTASVSRPMASAPCPNTSAGRFAASRCRSPA